MRTEQALDLAYENPYTVISTENLYEDQEVYFYYDKFGTLKNQEGIEIQENDIYKIIPESDDEEFNDWIEIDIEVPESTLDDGYGDYYNEDEYED